MLRRAVNHSLLAPPRRQTKLKPNHGTISGQVGWPGRAFATFTTAQPSAQPRFAPMGLSSTTLADQEKWRKDRRRFPPYHCSYTNGVVHKKHGWRMLSVEEKELIMGFPVRLHRKRPIKSGENADRGGSRRCKAHSYRQLMACRSDCTPLTTPLSEAGAMP